MKNINKIAFYIATLLLFVSCGVDNPIDSEQYFKQIYLVGAYNTLQEKEVAYQDAPSEIFVSVAVSGSLQTDEDVSATLGLAHQVNIDNYNYKNVTGEDAVQYVALSSDAYSLSAWNCTVKSGEQYVRVPINIESDKISCDECRVIPLKITDADVTIASDTVLLVSLKMVNDYSGACTVSGKSVQYDNSGNLIPENTSSISTPRTLTAVNKNTVRLFHKAMPEMNSNISKYAFTLTVNPDNTISVDAWNELAITDGGGTYNPAEKTFVIWYDYTENGKKYKMELTIVGEK